MLFCKPSEPAEPGFWGHDPHVLGTWGHVPETCLFPESCFPVRTCRPTPLEATGMGELDKSQKDLFAHPHMVEDLIHNFLFLSIV